MVLYANPNSTNAGIYGLTTIGRNSYSDDVLEMYTIEKAGDNSLTIKGKTASEKYSQVFTTTIISNNFITDSLKF